MEIDEYQNMREKIKEEIRAKRLEIIKVKESEMDNLDDAFQEEWGVHENSVVTLEGMKKFVERMKK